MNNKSRVFRFKQFVIDDAQCAMKVGTDAILLGSWAQAKESESKHRKSEYPKYVLDIGTGSGIIAIMMAQKLASSSSNDLHDVQIVGIDSDNDAVMQAKLNAQNSPWSNALSFQRKRLQDFHSDLPFDLIVSNPPFFNVLTKDLHKNDANFMTKNRQQARHTVDLSFEDLFMHVARLLSIKGKFYCILPADQSTEILNIGLEYNLHCFHQCRVKNSETKNAKRILLGFSKEQKTMEKTQLVIRNNHNQYSEDFKRICKAFYQNF